LSDTEICRSLLQSRIATCSEIAVANLAKEIETAITSDSVIAVVNEYLRTLPSGLTSWLPRECRPPYPLSHPDEIRLWHEIVSRECTKPGAIYNSRLQEHAVIFLCAARRLDELIPAAARGPKKTGADSSSPTESR
jgi:hypothetical protein